nr:MAG: RNA-dependent RNA polymerase [Riboviria sp.]
MDMSELDGLEEEVCPSVVEVAPHVVDDSGEPPVAEEAVSSAVPLSDADRIRSFRDWLRPRVRGIKRDNSWTNMAPAMIMRWLKIAEIDEPSEALYEGLLSAVFEFIEPSKAELSLHALMESPDIRARMLKINEALAGEISTVDWHKMDQWCWDAFSERGALHMDAYAEQWLSRKSWFWVFPAEFRRDTLDFINFLSLGMVRWWARLLWREVYWGNIAHLETGDSQVMRWSGTWTDGWFRSAGKLNVFHPGNEPSPFVRV